MSTAVRDAWTSPYVGNAHTMLLENVCRLNENRRPSPYRTSVLVLQSSGTGKSRTVDELAKDIFVIPLNIRKTAPGYPYPHADTSISHYLVGYYHSWDAAIAAYYSFFSCLFCGILAEVKAHLKCDFEDARELAQAWRAHLMATDARCADQRTNRERLYADIIEVRPPSYLSACVDITCHITRIESLWL